MQNLENGMSGHQKMSFGTPKLSFPTLCKKRKLFETFCIFEIYVEILQFWVDFALSLGQLRAKEGGDHQSVVCQISEISEIANFQNRSYWLSASP